MMACIWKIYIFIILFKYIMKFIWNLMIIIAFIQWVRWFVRLDSDCDCYLSIWYSYWCYCHYFLFVQLGYLYNYYYCFYLHLYYLYWSRYNRLYWTRNHNLQVPNLLSNSKIENFLVFNLIFFFLMVKSSLKNKYYTLFLMAKVISFLYRNYTREF